jgi:hypothetical protein
LQLTNAHIQLASRTILHDDTQLSTTPPHGQTSSDSKSNQVREREREREIHTCVCGAWYSKHSMYSTMFGCEILERNYQQQQQRYQTNEYHAQSTHGTVTNNPIAIGYSTLSLSLDTYTMNKRWRVSTATTTRIQSLEHLGRAIAHITNSKHRGFGAAANLLQHFIVAHTWS